MVNRERASKRWNGLSPKLETIWKSKKTIKRNAQGGEVREIQTDRNFSNASERKRITFPQNE
jgi:hypothetical protein